MDIQGLKEEAASGKVSVEKLLGVIAWQQERIDELEAKLAGKNPTERLDESYSEKAEEQRKRGKRKARRGKPLRRGRISTAEKIKLAERTEAIYPGNVSAAQCQLSHTRVVWRLEQGRAVLVAYEIYRCGKLYGKPPGVLGRGEFGIEILVALAYQVYCVGLSMDKACRLLSFFQQLNLRKSQADALLNQLAKAWEAEFETLCRLLANSAVVHADETSWSIRSVWAFLNDQLTVLLYGVNKDGNTLAELLDKNTFAGTLVSDDASVYQGFTRAQKCWAHLIRKAIKLTLQAPNNTSYRQFADELLAIYRDAKRAASDGRLGDAGRLSRVKELDDRLTKLCYDRWVDEDTSGSDVENDYRRLCNEIMRLVCTDELFTFVITPGVEGTNNAAERQLRGDATARKTCQTSKTARGAKRRSIVVSVLQSIGKHLKQFTLASIIEEVQRWMHDGRSCFSKQVQKLGADPPRADSGQPLPIGSILDRLILKAD